MAKGTPATLALTRAGVAFTLHEYDYDPNAARIGMQAAEALGVDPARLLKTLMAKAGNAVVCVLVPSNAEARAPKMPRCCRRPRLSVSPAIMSAASRRSGRRSARGSSSKRPRSPEIGRASCRE